jgi:predicted nucleic-acid-binding protein
MICLDTNVLIRYVMGDDPRQSLQANAFVRTLTTANPGWLSLASIQELVWFLDRHGKMSRVDIATVLESLESKDEFVIERAREFNKALRFYRQTRADFADCLIAVVAQTAGCSRIVTFDKIAARDLGMERLGA